jgi:hypothetical protein
MQGIGNAVATLPADEDLAAEFKTIREVLEDERKKEEITIGVLKKQLGGKMADGQRYNIFFRPNRNENIFGYVNLDKTPFEVVINSDIVEYRQAVSLVHELLHVGAELLKLPLEHNDLHRLASLLLTEYVKRNGTGGKDVPAILHALGIRLGRTEMKALSHFVDTDILPILRKLENEGVLKLEG